MGSLPNVKAYTDHPGAGMFKAPEVDPQAPNLKFKDKKDREKKVGKVTNHGWSHRSHEL